MGDLLAFDLLHGGVSLFIEVEGYMWHGPRLLLDQRELVGWCYGG